MEEDRIIAVGRGDEIPERFVPERHPKKFRIHLSYIALLLVAELCTTPIGQNNAVCDVFGHSIAKQ